MTKKRDLFTELAEGFDALLQQREGKLTLRTFKVQSKPEHNEKLETRPHQTECSGCPADTHGGAVF